MPPSPSVLQKGHATRLQNYIYIAFNRIQLLPLSLYNFIEYNFSFLQIQRISITSASCIDIGG